jgi:hypothetical protein
VSETVECLIIDLLQWIGPEPRPYGEVLEAWRTSCPRLPVWEDATDRGFIARVYEPGRGALVAVSAAGAAHLREHRAAESSSAAKVEAASRRRSSAGRALHS